MALMGSALGSEVGLRLLLSPTASNTIVRSACTLVGLGFPVYSTHKAIERKDPVEQEMWLVYWSAYGCFSAAEILTDKLVSWFPMYYHAKFVFLVWLQLPNNYGARHLYLSLLRPFLLKHHAKLDRIVDGTRNDMNKFMVSHQSEILAFRKVIHKATVAACRAFEEFWRATRVEGPREFGSDTTPSPPADDVSVAPSDTAEGSPVEDQDPSWIEVPRAQNQRSSRGPSR